MGIIDDTLKALDRIPVWKRLQALPAEHDALASRVAEIERKMRGASGATCPACGSVRFARQPGPTDDSMEAMGYVTDHFRCLDCQHQEKRHRDVAPK